MQKLLQWEYFPYKSNIEGLKNKNKNAGAYDMIYDEFKQLSRKSWEDEYI